MSRPDAESRRVVTVIFTDIVGSSAVTERLDPEALRNVLREYFGLAAAALERHGGTVEKFIGDAVMAVFGVPRVEEDDALRAVRAAVEMRRSVMRLSDELERSYGVRLQTRIGVNTGEVVAGDPANDGTLATGEAVVVARRLEQEAGADEILVGPQTHRLVRDAVVAERAGPLALKGLSAPLEVWRVVDVVPEAAGVRRNFDAPLVDRERERSVLEAALERAVAGGRCELVTVLGAPGIGKSRLAFEFIAGLAGRARVLEGRCLNYGDGITFWPIREIVRRAAAVVARDSPERARAKIAALVPGDAGPRAADAIAAAIGLAAASAPTDEIFVALRRLFEHLAAERPLVLLLEDVNWAEPTLLDLLEYLAGWSRSAPILLLCLGRPDLLELRPSWAATTTVTLDPLGEADMRELIRNAAGADADADADESRIGAWAEGNPLFAEEMVRMLLDAGGTAGGGTSRDVPPTIHALLAARLDRLEPDERTLIGCASVIGRQFGWTGVTELAPSELRPRVPGALQALVRKRMVLPDEQTALGEDAFRFSHILMRDAAYRALPRAQVAELHERFADWLEQRTGSSSSEYAEILGYHLESAAAARRQIAPRDERAVELGARAGRLLAAAGARALARDDVPAATSLLERAVVLLAGDGEPFFSALLDLAQALRERGDLTRAEGVVEQALHRARSIARPELLARARIEQSWLRMIIDPDVEADQILQVAREAAAVCESERDELGLARAWLHVGDAHWMRCRFVDMERVLERALVHAESVGAQREISAAVSGLVRCALVGPRAVSAGIERVRNLRDRLPGTRPAVTGEVEFTLAALEAMRGRVSEARAHLDAAARALEGFGLNVRYASLRLYGGWVELSNGDPNAAERELRAGYESLKEMGEHAYLSTLAGMLAQTLYEQGRFDEAGEVAAVGTSSASSDDIVSHVFLRGALAKLAARRGDVEAAVRLAEQAVALARATDFVDLTAGALRDLGEVLMLSARRPEGNAAFAQAIVLYDVKENLAAVLQARRRRDGLAAS